VRWERTGSGSRIQVSPELVELPAGTSRWQAPFDASLTDVFQVQADVAARVAEALGVALASTDKHTLAERPTKDLAAYDAFLRGEQILITQGQIDPKAMRESTANYLEAVRRESNFALAWTRLTRTTSLQYANGDDTVNTGRLARQAADRALALAPDRPEAYVAIGSLRPQVLHDDPGGIDALEHARTLAPRDPDVLSLLGLWLRNVGRYDEAVARAAEAARLDPRSPLVLRRYATVLMTAGRPALADSVARVGLALSPANVELHTMHLWARLDLGDSAGARVALREMLHTSARQYLNLVGEGGLIWLLDDSLQAQLLRASPDSFSEHRRLQGLVVLAGMHQDLGHGPMARAYADSAVPVIEAELSRNPGDQLARRHLAFAYALQGRRREALAEAERVFAGWDANTRALRQDDRAKVLLNIDLATGELAGAVAWIDTLLRISPAWTRASLPIGPQFVPLHGRTDFERLVRGSR
jgi:tetratricopeptide (TPR) repeat protein